MLGIRGLGFNRGDGMAWWLPNTAHYWSFVWLRKREFYDLKYELRVVENYKENILVVHGMTQINLTHINLN